jgi:hypothetical protein
MTDVEWKAHERAYQELLVLEKKLKREAWLYPLVGILAFSGIILACFL